MAELIIAILLGIMILFMIVLVFVKGAGVAVQIINAIFDLAKDLIQKGYRALRCKLGLNA